MILLNRRILFKEKYCCLKLLKQYYCYYCVTAPRARDDHGDEPFVLTRIVTMGLAA